MGTSAHATQRRAGLRLLAVPLITLMVSCGNSAQPPHAAPGTGQVDSDLWVDSYEDQVDADPGDLRCATAEGLCTLRAAIMEANASAYNAKGERHTIRIPPGVYTLSLPNALSTGDIGLGDVLARPIIESEATGSLILSVPMHIYGAGARQTIIDANQLDRVFELKPGADATIADLGVTGGAGNSLGGGIYAQAHLLAQRLEVRGNRASGGGGIFVNPLGSLDLRDSTVSDNVANGQAGGIRIDSRGTITNSTISHNRALGLADPVAMGTGVPFTFAQGGGIDVRGLSVLIRNSTIAFNEAAAGGAGVHFDTAYVDALPDPVTGTLNPPLFDLILENTIIANNVADVPQADCLVTVGISRILSQGNNLDSDGSCTLEQPGDLPGFDPRLSELGDWGGPTDTLALLPSSPARGAGQLGNCTAADQRGLARAGDGACDIGAFEAQN